MERYSEYYEDDARRLAEMLAGEINGSVEMSTADNAKDFPQPPKVSFFPTRTPPVYIVLNHDGMTIAEIAFVAPARNGNEDIILKDRMIYRIRLGRKIAMKRKQRNMTEQELADMVGTKRSAICGAERGKYKSDCDFLIKVASALNCTLDFDDI